MGAEIGLDYVTNDDSMRRSFDAPPIIVNFFITVRSKNLPERVVDAMPELPEVETIRQVLEPQVKGITITAVTVSRPEVISHPTLFSI